MLRRVRIILVVGFSAGVVAAYYLNQAGLPGFIKRPLLAQFREQGWEVDCARARLRWHRGLLLEGLSMTETRRKTGLEVFLDEAQCHMDYRALARFQVRMDTLVLEGGRIFWTLGETNRPEQTFQLNDLRGTLRVASPQCWEVQSLHAECFGARFSFHGSLTNALAVRHWKLPRLDVPTTPEPRVPKDVRERWRRVFNVVEQFRFAGPPEIDCRFSGDGLDFRSFHSVMVATAPGLESPWVSGTNLTINAEIFPARFAQENLQVELALNLNAAALPWGQAEDLKVFFHGEPTMESLLPSSLNLGLELRRLQTPWGRSDETVLTATSSVNPTNNQLRLTQFQWQHENLLTSWGSCVQARASGQSAHPFTNLWPASTSAQLHLLGVNSRWADLRQASLSVTGTLADPHLLAQTNLTWPERVAGLSAGLSGIVSNVHSAKLDIDWAEVSADWLRPELRFQLTGAIAEEPLQTQATLDTNTREVRFRATSAVDPKLVSGLLTPPVRQWLSRYTWEDPPRVEAAGRLLLPSWTNAQPDWRVEVRPSIAVTGTFQVGFGSYRNVPFTSARSPFVFSNLVWRLTDLHLARPEGELQGTYESHAETRDFHWVLQSQVFPLVAAPLLESDPAKRALDFFEFKIPPRMEAELWGNWADQSKIGFVGKVEGTNMVFRGEVAEYFQAEVQYTNRIVTVTRPVLRRTANEEARADGIRVDTVTEKLYLTNVTGRMMPIPVARVIGPQALKAMLPYQFDQPPEARINGVVDFKRRRHEWDLRFDIAGGPFHWKMFHLNQAAGTILWYYRTLTLTNMTGKFHEGEAKGHAWFDFGPTNDTVFNFATQITNVNFHTFMEDLTGRTNVLEGLLSGDLAITNARANDWKSWQGYGWASLRNGLIWDIPMFGIFSPVLNVFVPGLGNSRAREATADFTLTNSVIHTSNLDVQATMMHMHFKGTADFQRNIDGRMEAELLRGMPAIGIVLSKVLWPVTKLFEYTLTGTVTKPKIEPVYFVPRILFFPFNPWKGLRDLFTEEKAKPPG